MAPWATGVKTGHTFGAGYVLVGSGSRKGAELISVVIGAPSEEARDRDSLDLLEYGFSQYRRRLPIRAGQALAEPPIRYSGGELPLRAARAIAVGLRPGQRLEVDVRAPAEVEGPIRRGARLGTATVFVDGRRIAAAPLRASSLDSRGERLRPGPQLPRRPSDHYRRGCVRDTDWRGIALPPSVPAEATEESESG